MSAGSLSSGSAAAAAATWRQLRFERRLFWRNPSAAFFSFVLPLLLLVLVASVFASERDELEILVPGIAGMAVMATTFNALAFNVTFLREQGILKRIRGTPLPIRSYLGGLIGSAVTNALVQVALVVLIGHFAYGVGWPRDPLTLVGFTALGVVTFGALGVAFAHAIPNFDAAAAYVNAIFLPVIFISGVFYSPQALPPVLEAAADALPLKYVIEGMAGAMVPGLESPADLGGVGIVVAWALVGITLAVRRFRWE
jgi:ABC-2 type transport system permease protein